MGRTECHPFFMSQVNGWNTLTRLGEKTFSTVSIIIRSKEIHYWFKAKTN